MGTEMSAERHDHGPAGPTDCSEAILRVYEFLDGELEPADYGRIKSHLDECVECLRHYQMDRTLKALIKRACGEEHAPDTLRATIMTRISMTVIRTEER